MFWTVASEILLILQQSAGPPVSHISHFQVPPSTFNKLFPILASRENDPFQSSADKLPSVGDQEEKFPKEVWGGEEGALEKRTAATLQDLIL